MTLWSKIVGKLWSKRQKVKYGPTPSEEQIENARKVLSFSRTAEWGVYSDYLCVSLGEAMESAFTALRQGDTNAMTVWIARAESIYRMLTEPHNAESIIEKSNQIIIKPEPRR